MTTPLDMSLVSWPTMDRMVEDIPVLAETLDTPTAFDVAAAPHFDALYRTARRMTGNEQDAEDLVQETVMRGYRAWDRFTPGTNVRAWLFRILMNNYITRYRRRVAEPRTTSLDDAEEFFLYNHIDRQRDEHLQASAEDEALGQLVDVDVRQAIEKLPEQFRVAVLLADVEDFSYREIADITGTKIGTVMSRIARGRRLLQKYLYDYAVDQGVIRPHDSRVETAAAEAGERQ